MKAEPSAILHDGIPSFGAYSIENVEKSREAHGNRRDGLTGFYLMWPGFDSVLGRSYRFWEHVIDSLLQVKLILVIILPVAVGATPPTVVTVIYVEG